MSRITIDIGNTRLKLRADGGPVIGLAHAGDPATVLRGHIAGIAMPGADVHIAQVFGADAETALEGALRDAGAARVRFAHSQAEHCGLRIAYADADTLGVDRFLAMAALWREQRRGFVTASAGTALTVDLVDDDGRHLGGYIAPGLHAMRAAVLDRTRFPHAQDAIAVGQPGTSTESCVAEAALAAALGLLTQVRTQRPNAVMVLGGGDAETLAPHLEHGWQLRPHLVLDGLDAVDDAQTAIKPRVPPRNT